MFIFTNISGSVSFKTSPRVIDLEGDLDFSLKGVSFMFEGLVAIGMTICVVCLVGIGLTAGYLTFMGEALV